MPRVALETQAVLEDARRTQILAAAARVFAQRGFERATINDIAKAAHLAEGSLYNYFRSKEELLIHIPQHCVRPGLSTLFEQTVLPDDLHGVERLLESVAGTAVKRMRANAAFWKVFLSALPHLSTSAREKYMQLFPVRGASILERLLREGIRRGLFRRDLNPVIAARTLPGMLMFFVLTQEVLLGRPLTPYDYNEVVSEVVGVFVHGVRSRATARRRRPGRARSRRL